MVIPLGVSEEVARQRLSGRLVHAASGRVYNAEEIGGSHGVDGMFVDPVTGDLLERRSDDQDAATLATRFQSYEKRSGELMAYLKTLQTIVTTKVCGLGK